MIQAANAASMRVSCDVNPSVRYIDPWQSAWDDVYEDNWWWINSALSIYEMGRDTGALFRRNDLTARFGENPTWENGLLMTGDLLTGRIVSTSWNYLLSPHVDRASAWIKAPLDSGKFMNMWTAGITDTLSGVFVPPEDVVPEEWYGSTDWYKHVYGSAAIIYGGYKTIQAANVPTLKFENQTHQFKSPNSRHFYSRISQGTRVKDLNTVIMPDVDVSSDVLAINSGKSIKVGDSYLVNNRIYRVHDGTLYPVIGEGFYQLDRGAYNALGIYKKFGNTQRADEILFRMKMTDEAKNKALEVYQAGGGK